MAGVLRVWFCREFVTATERSREAGIQRPAARLNARSIAAGESSANQRPPSEPRLFCGAK